MRGALGLSVKTKKTANRGWKLLVLFNVEAVGVVQRGSCWCCSTWKLLVSFNVEAVGVVQRAVAMSFLSSRGGFICYFPQRNISDEN